MLFLLILVLGCPRAFFQMAALKEYPHLWGGLTAPNLKSKLSQARPPPGPRSSFSQPVLTQPLQCPDQNSHHTVLKLLENCLSPPPVAHRTIRLLTAVEHSTHVSSH